MSVSLYGNGNTIIQVVPVVQTLSITTTSTSYVATGLTATITPQSTNSKILIMAQLTGSGLPAGVTGGEGYAIYRNGSSLWAPSPADGTGPFMCYGANSSAVFSTVPLNYVDSPATTSATTYAIYWRSYNGNSVALGGGGTSATLGQHSLILMEISGS